MNCYKCKKRRDHEKIKIIQGCTENKEVVVFPTDEFKFYGCIGKFRDPSFYGLKKMYDFFKSGVNPYGGSLEETPNKLVELGTIIDNLISEKIKEDHGKRSKR